MDTPEDKRSDQSGVSPRDEVEKDASEAAQVYRDLIRKNPRFRDTTSPGRGYIIVGANPAPPKTSE